MNSKILFILLFFISACGVKKNPIPPSTPNPSLFDEYNFVEEENIEKKEENDKKQ